MTTTQATRCWYYLHTLGGMRRCIREPDYHDGDHDYGEALTWDDRDFGTCDTCESAYDLTERGPNRCGDCGDCGACCTHADGPARDRAGEYYDRQAVGR
jgi:hypothetical protein